MLSCAFLVSANKPGLLAPWYCHPCARVSTAAAQRPTRHAPPLLPQVFFMQCGFALLEAGTVRIKNTKNIRERLCRVDKGGGCPIESRRLYCTACGARCHPPRAFHLLPRGAPSATPVLSTRCTAKPPVAAVLKNVIDACVSTMAWWSVGWAFAVGKCGDSGFIGYTNFFSSDAGMDSGTYWATCEWH